MAEPIPNQRPVRLRCGWCLTPLGNGWRLDGDAPAEQVSWRLRAPARVVEYAGGLTFVCESRKHPRVERRVTWEHQVEAVRGAVESGRYRVMLGADMGGRDKRRPVGHLVTLQAQEASS